MNHDTASLDWPVVREALARAAWTSLGAERARALAPLTDLEQVRAAHDEIDEWLRLRADDVMIPLGGVSDVRELLVRASKGDVLEGPDLLSAARSLRMLCDTERALDEVAEAAPRLAAIASAIRVDVYLVDELEDSFEPTGQLSVWKYPELAELRDAIQSLHTQVRATLDGLVRGDAMADLLQDRFWTVRDNRYVLPIKSHAKRWDLGIVHDTSGSGQTVFVEPHAVIDLNNRLRLAEGRLRAAEHRILTTLSRQLGREAAVAMKGLEAAATLDLAAARATLAERLRATRPKTGREGVLIVEAARHPVLVLRDVPVVANDLSVGPGQPGLVLSGPNAGGKTVALKTMGLCALLVQHGCFVPAAEGSRVDLFDGVVALIGDQQTVEGDLSSFSAHLVALRRMVNEAAPHQLIVLDEIASGTDPAQGAALARAVLEHLVERGARAVVTTHFAPLKALAAADARFGIAAVQYADGSPTYRVVRGATGESHALSTARRIGLPGELVTRAEQLLGEGATDLTAALEAVEAQRAALDRAEREARAVAAQLAERERTLALREEDLRTRAKALEEKAAKHYLDRLAKAEKAIGQVVAQLQAGPSHAGVKAAKASVDALRALAPRPEPTPTPVVLPAALAAGDRVRHVKLGKVGDVVSVGGGGVQVRFGAMVVTAKLKELERLGGPTAPEPRAFGGGFTPVARDAAIEEAARTDSTTLDLRGHRVDEAFDQSEAFFDRSMMSGTDTVFLLHGHGTGALKDALRSWLRDNRYVKDWAPANEEQGGDAFTVVHLIG
jgi:DNA mismatch repair protein MutS2